MRVAWLCRKPCAVRRNRRWRGCALGFPSPPADRTAPSLTINPPWAKPLELFAGLIGTPGQNEADPSIMVALIAPLLFGYMFGDIGHGAVLFVARVLPPVPQLQQAEEIRSGHAEFGVRLVGGLLMIDGPLARVVDAHRRDQHDDFGQRVALGGLDHHPALARVHRQPGQGAARSGQSALLVDRLQLGQGVPGLVDQPVGRRVDERKFLRIAETQREHLQDDPDQPGALDFRLGVFGPGNEIVFGKQPDTGAGADPAAASGALVARRLRDRLHRPATAAPSNGWRSARFGPDRNR